MVDANILTPDSSHVKGDAASETGDLTFGSAYEAKHEQDMNFIPPPLPPRPQPPSSLQKRTNLKFLLQESRLRDRTVEFIRPDQLRAASKVCQILDLLAVYVEWGDSPGAIEYIQTLYKTPNLLPSTLFSLCSYEKTDYDVVEMSLAFIRSFSIDNPRTWRLDGFELIGRILILACGPPTPWNPNQRHCAIFRECLRRVGERLFPLCLWLFTVDGNTALLMPQLLACGSQGGRLDRRLTRTRECWEFGYDVLRHISRRHYLNFTGFLSSL